MSIRALRAKTALLLDMNGTFMFGEDRFGETQDFAAIYAALGGTLPPAKVDTLIRAAYDYLDARYTDPRYRNDFPPLAEALAVVTGSAFDPDETDRLVATFAHHERGHVPAAYAEALQRLSRRYTLGFVIDIWAPKAAWLETFARVGIDGIASAMSFSSDHGHVKPSPVPFEAVLAELGVAKSGALVIGDSVRRDLGGALAAGIDCALVGGADDPAAVATAANLLELTAVLAG